MKKQYGHRLEDSFFEAFKEVVRKLPFGHAIMEVYRASKEDDRLHGMDMVLKLRDGKRLLVDVTGKEPAKKKGILKLFPSGKFAWRKRIYELTETTSLVVQIGPEGVSPSRLGEWVDKRFKEGRLVPPT